jgi:cell division protein ZapA (FtsZ GTPase activity inhibitor)
MTTTLEIQLNGARYPVACSEAEAPRVRQIAEQLQSRLAGLHKDLGHAQISDAHLLALMGLILMDEVAEAQSKAASAPIPEPALIQDNSEDTELFINAVSHLTDRVNLIAQRLKAA